MSPSQPTIVQPKAASRSPVPKGLVDQVSVTR